MIRETIENRLEQWHIWLVDRTADWFAEEPEQVGKCTNSFMCPNGRHSKRCIAYTTDIDVYCRRFGKI